MRTLIIYSSLITLALASTTAHAEKFAVEQVLETPTPAEFQNDNDSNFGEFADQDGNTAVVADNDAGRVEIFTRQTDGSWQHLQTLTIPVNEFTPVISYYFAQDVAIEGDTIAIGDVDADGDQDTEADAGVVYLYRRQSDGSWSYDTALGNPVDDTEANYDAFGSAIDIENGVMVIGASDDEVTADGYKLGSAFIYKRDGSGNWNFHKQLTPNAGENDKIYLGSSIATDGNRVIVGGPTIGGLADPIGVVYIYEVDGDSVTRFTTPTTGANTIYYGRGVDIHDDFAFIGAPWYDTPANDAGIVYVYKYNGSTWEDFTTLDWYGLERLDGFGYDLDFDGTDLIVSASGYLDRIHYFHYDSANQQFDRMRSWQASDYVNFNIGEELGTQNVHITSSGNLIATAVDQVFIYEAEAQLELVIQDDTDPVAPETNFTYSLMVTNNDAEVTATDVVVSGDLPADFTLVENDTSCSADEGVVTTITCSLDTLGPEQTQSFVVDVYATTPGSYTFSADMEFNEWPAEGSVLNASETTTVEAADDETSTDDTGSDGDSGSGGSVSWPLLLLGLLGLLRGFVPMTAKHH